MRKPSVLVLALVTCLAVSAVPAHAAKTKVNTKVSIDFGGEFSGGGATGDPYSPYNPVTFNGDFSGKVKGKKGCKKNRKVTISRGIGSDRSDDSGNYSVDIHAVPAAGDYTATVKKKKLRKGGKTIICKRAKDTIHIG
jgi:hypothetical protein